MAKPRKQKSDEQKSESSGSAVLHQKLCLSIDMKSMTIYGHTEMKIVIQERGYAALHADNMTIRSISVDGEATDFEYTPHYQLVEEEERWCSVSCSNSAADVARSAYISSLDKEMTPNLLIACDKSAKSVDNQYCQENGESSKLNEEQVGNGCNGHTEHKNVKLVCIDYIIEMTKTGIHFGDNMLHTDNQIRRAHCWFPCIDSSSQRCPFDLEFTVDSEFVAVSNGNLLYQILSKDDPPRKTYVYKLTDAVSPGWISLAVAPFKILPDSHNDIISHMCLSENFSKLQNTVGFFHDAFSHYEVYLATSFPFGSYKQVFIPPEQLIFSMNLGASMCIFSSQLLFDEKVIDQAIETRIKLAYALARQWFGVYITAEEPTDEWLLDGLAGFLADLFIKQYLGNNEAQYRRYKANCAVCKADISSATSLSSSSTSSDLYGTQSIGLHGKIRSWKAIAVLQMLEKQMGPDSFRKILQTIVYRALDATRPMRTVSTKEFRHLANKVGNVERPFLKEFFPRWVESSGCPVLRMGLSYNKRRNMIELAVMRGCTAKVSFTSSGNLDNETREGDTGWPGMMSIRVHEIDGMYDHPSLPMAGETWQLLEIQCHSKLAAKRIQKPKKGSRPDGSDDNADSVPTPETRTGMDSPLLWVRVDPEMEYLSEVHFHQTVHMWINQLEKDKDVIAQAQAITSLEKLPKKLPKLSFSVVNALNNFLSDSKAFWRVRIDAAYALAHTASEDTDWAGLLHLVKFYKGRRFDADIGLPRPNDFRDFSEYFVLEAIPHAIALVRAADEKSPREAVEFVLQLLKYNDNSGNPYSDVYWLAALVQSIGELELGQQGVLFLSSILKRIDRLLQFDSLMPGYNGILTVSCIRTLVQIAVKMSASVPLESVSQLIKPFRNFKRTSWKVRIEASRVLLDLELYSKGLDAALSLFVKFLEEEPSSRGEVKLAVHMMHLCQINVEPESGGNVPCPTLVALLRLLASRKAFHNVLLRHNLFCILQIIAGRPPTLHGVPRVGSNPVIIPETSSEKPAISRLKILKPQEPNFGTKPNRSPDVLPIAEPAKEADTVSNMSERRTRVLKIRVKQPASSNAERLGGRSRGGPDETESGPCNSVSVDAPAIGSNERTSNPKVEEEFPSTSNTRKDSLLDDEEEVVQKTGRLQALSTGGPLHAKGKKKMKDKDRKRKRESKGSDPQYLEQKRQKKEKKRREKDVAKMQKGSASSSLELQHSVKESKPMEESSKGGDTRGSAGPKLRIKFKSQGVGNI